MDIKQIKELMRKFDESGLSGMKISQGEFSIEMEKATGLVAAPVQQVAVATAPAAAAPATEAAPAAEISGESIDSPMVGTFYGAPSPDSPAFVKVGDTIKKGHIVAILEAMKIMNELEAEFDCKIVDILVKDGQAVEYDMPLYVIEKL
ncbi:MAG: acetyl-CoA carboxylase biotin carboxyl carrier protein [Epsilonproteobacteria bacterium]|nr:MAG: acetyl-CoA carboxylase biotin carboxyl carrier protein [Campylobacterota bacterium]